MYTNQRQNKDTKELRRLGGRWLKEKRENSGLSQRQLAEILGVEYYTFISQIETGHGRIPPDRYEAWADAIKVDLADFVREILRYYDPVTFSILFGAGAAPVLVDMGGASAHERDALFTDNRQLEEQVRELQRLLGKKTMELEQMREMLSSAVPPATRQPSRQRDASAQNGTGTGIAASRSVISRRNIDTDMTATLDGVPSYGETGD